VIVKLLLPLVTVAVSCTFVPSAALFEPLSTVLPALSTDQQLTVCVPSGIETALL